MYMWCYVTCMIGASGLPPPLLPLSFRRAVCRQEVVWGTTVRLCFTSSKSDRYAKWHHVMLKHISEKRRTTTAATLGHNQSLLLSLFRRLRSLFTVTSIFTSNYDSVVSLYDVSISFWFYILNCHFLKWGNALNSLPVISFMLYLSSVFYSV